MTEKTVQVHANLQVSLFDSVVPSPVMLSEPILLAGGKLLQTTPVYESYWRFACERQEILFKRLSGIPGPWTKDPVLARYKFTNAYRAADRTSQYLIREVIYRKELPATPEEVVFRILLFKLFNKIETWEYLEHELGPITWSSYKFDAYDRALTCAMNAKSQIYSAAYMMPPGGAAFGYKRKHQNHLRLLERMMADGLPQRLQDAATMERAFKLLRAYPTIGDFLAYQFVTDINYSTVTDFCEQDFVVPGPGARDGIYKCFSDLGGLSESAVIRLMMERQEEEFQRLGLSFRSLWGRPLQLIDCQNLFCEVSKYARARHPDIQGCSNRTRIKQTFKPAQRDAIDYFFPPKWGINVLIPTNEASGKLKTRF